MFGFVDLLQPPAWWGKTPNDINLECCPVNFLRDTKGMEVYFKIKIFCVP